MPQNALPPAERKIYEAIRGTGAIFTMNADCPPLPITAKVIHSQPNLFSGKIKPNLPPHYLLASEERHTAVFFQMSLALRYAHVSYLIAQRIKDQLEKAGLLKEVEVILGPPMGSLPLIYALHQLIDSPILEAMYLERMPGKGFRLGRGFDISGKQVLVVDDVFTSGGSITQARLACEEFCKAHEVGYFLRGVAVALNRSRASTLPLAIRAPALTIVSALLYPVEDWGAEECQPCADGHPLVRI